VSRHGPYGRYAPLRGTQSAVVRHLRRGDWTAGIPALSAALGIAERNVWLAIVALDTRGLIRARRHEDGSMRLWITKAGRSIRL
jgi:hypothetical protein